MNKNEKKTTHSRTSQLEKPEFAPAGVVEKPERLQPHYIHEKLPFDGALFLFAQYTPKLL
jgi:hypothetical protein